jgi:DNA polymerase III subunit alpha
MKTATFDDCECKFCINNQGTIDFDIDIEHIDLECPKTWRMISDGNTKGCFQLESRLGQSMAKKLKPENIEQLSALISIMRPGCLEAYRDGKSVSNHYIDKKNKNEALDFFHPALEPILSNTYGEMVYQEQAMQICQKIANFDLTEADKLRKAIGKKRPEEMVKIKKLFLQKSESMNIISKSEAEELFGWIEKSQRYSFNKSHAVSYAYNAYLSAYAKAHFPIEFFASYLKFAKDKIDPLKEIQELISNANEMNISIKLPSILKPEKEFFINTKDNSISFGLTNIKGLGDSVYDKLLDLLKQYDVSSMNFIEIYCYILRHINSTACKGLISCGAISNSTISRTRMLFYYDILNNLTNREADVLLKIFNNQKIDDALQILIDSSMIKITAKRKQTIISLINTLKHPPYNLDDSPEWLANNEKFYLGASITCHKIDGCDIYAANVECKDLSQGTKTKTPILGAEISDINIIKTKKGVNPGQEMAFIKVTDSTGSADLVIFPEEFSQYRDLLIDGNTLLIKLDRSRDKETFIVKKCWQV